MLLRIKGVLTHPIEDQITPDINIDMSKKQPGAVTMTKINKGLEDKEITFIPVRIY